MTPIRKRIAAAPGRSLRRTPALLTTFNECRHERGHGAALGATRTRSRRSYGIKLGFMSFFVKAAIDALKLIPAVNGEIRELATNDGRMTPHIVYKNYLDHRRLLERVAADHGRRHLPGDADQRDAVELRVGDRRHQVRGAGAGGRHRDAHLAGRAGYPLGGKRAALLVPRQDRSQFVRDARQRLVQRHAAAAGIGEDRLNAVPHQRLDQDVGPRDQLCLGGGLGGGGHNRERKAEKSADNLIRDRQGAARDPTSATQIAAPHHRLPARP